MNYTVSNKILPTYYASSAIPSDKAYRITKPIPLRINSIGALHHHESFEIGVCTEGCAIAHIGERIYNCQRGDIQFIPPYLPHMNANNTEKESEWIWICFSSRRAFLDFGVNMYKLLTELGRTSFGGMIRASEFPELENAVYRFISLSDREDDILCDAERKLVLAKMIIELSKLGNTDKSNNGYTSRILPAVQMISTGFADKALMREESIAHKCNMSVSYLRLLFKRETGMSPSQFIAKTRISAAAFLLTETKLGILDIALQCGYEQSSSLNHAFKRFYGITPSEYRNGFGI